MIIMLMIKIILMLMMVITMVMTMITTYMLMNTYSQLARQSQSPQKQRWQCQRREEAYL